LRRPDRSGVALFEVAVEYRRIVDAKRFASVAQDSAVLGHHFGAIVYRMRRKHSEAVREFRGFARAYLAQMGDLPYPWLRASQNRPWPSVAFGAAGIAYALLEQDGRGRQRRLEHADRWLRSAARAAPSEYAVPDLPTRAVRHSFHYARAGTNYVAQLVADTRHHHRRYERALQTWLVACRNAVRGPSELLLGVAGYLNAARILHRRTGDARALAAGDTLAEVLLTRGQRRAGSWARERPFGFAHGRAGICHALLGWSMHAKRDLPGWFFGDLARTTREIERLGVAKLVPGADAAFQRGWCNGASGLVLLWTKAYEHTNERGYLRMARLGARSALTCVRGALPDLCCGLAGRAYAFLAMDRVEPGQSWYERAVDFGVKAAERMLADRGSWPHGLYKGYPGLVCLARDLARSKNERRGFPLVE
jgi:serine/threonine-protein kinase